MASVITLLVCVQIITAHPADGVLQRTSVEVQPTSLTIRVGLLGGIESYRALQYELDQRGDPAISDTELTSWLQRSWIPTIGVEIDGNPVLLNSLNTSASFEGAPETVFLSQPLIVTVSVPIPTDGKEHTLLIRNDYSSLHSEYQLELLAGPGVRAEQQSNAGRNMVVSFRTDPTLAPGPTTQAGFSVTSAASSRSSLDQIRDHWLWIMVGVMFGAVGVWLALARRNDQAVRPVTVRQSQASRKKPVAVRTIEAPDE